MADDDGGSALSRRTILHGALGIGMSAAAAAVLPACGSDRTGRDEAGLPPAEGPPEVTTFRINKQPLSCVAAQAVAAGFMEEEGFTDVRYVDIGAPGNTFPQFDSGMLDMILYPAPLVSQRIDAGDPIVILAGVEVGCFQVFGTEAITKISDLKGRTIATGGPGSPDDVLLAVTLANVGIDVRTDVRVVTHAPAEAAGILASGEVDGVSVLPPYTRQVAATGIGHVVVDSMMDEPWSQYFCCMAVVRRDFLEKNPIATRRALRALLKGADVVAEDPERGARAMVDLGFTQDYAGALADLRMIPYDVWRTYDPADTLRFYALRLREAGLIKGTPESIVTRGTDFRLLERLKRELRKA